MGCPGVTEWKGSNASCVEWNKFQWNQPMKSIHFQVSFLIVSGECKEVSTTKGSIDISLTLQKTRRTNILNPKMEVWKMMFLSNRWFSRSNIGFQGWFWLVLSEQKPPFFVESWGPWATLRSLYHLKFDILLMAEILHQFIGSLSIYFISRVSYIPGGARFQPSTVLPWFGSCRLGGGNSNIFLLLLLPGEMIQFD